MNERMHAEKYPEILEEVSRFLPANPDAPAAIGAETAAQAAAADREVVWAEFRARLLALRAMPPSKRVVKKPLINTQKSERTSMSVALTKAYIDDHDLRKQAAPYIQVPDLDISQPYSEPTEVAHQRFLDPEARLWSEMLWETGAFQWLQAAGEARRRAQK